MDIGGVFMHVTQQFWDQIKDYECAEFGNASLFIPQDDTYIISSNPLLLHSNNFIILGKLLFWSLIHNGAWPHWLHKFHFKLIFKIDINHIQILREVQPQIYEIIRNIENFNEELRPGRILGLKDWGIEYNLQVINKITPANYLLLNLIINIILFYRK